MASMVDEITRHVLVAIATRKPDAVAAIAGHVANVPPIAPLALASPEPPKPPDLERAATRVEPVRRVTPLRLRSGSILGLDISRPEPGTSGDDRD